MIEHQEWIEPALVSLCEHASEFDAIAVAGRLTCDLLLNTAAYQRGLDFFHIKIKKFAGLDNRYSLGLDG